MKTALFILISLSLSVPAQATAMHHGKESNTENSDDSLSVIEKVYLHTDRTYYYPGDDIWFKAYLVDATSMRPSELSKNLHIELISPSSEIMSGKIIRIDSGTGNGDFRLSDKISAGRYRLRAYTNYMRNFGDQLFFIKEIIVINPSGDQIRNSDNSKLVSNKIRIDFFPEGGSLVNNVSSIVAFKATNIIGNGTYVCGNIYSSSGKIITTIRSVHLGMGTFFLRPLPGENYYAICRGADSIDFKTELPHTMETGINLCISLNRKKELLITTKTNLQTLKLVSGQDLLLTVSARNDEVQTIRYRLEDLVTNFTIPTGDLPDGILVFTLTMPEDLPFSERLVFIQNEPTLNLNIKSDKNIYKKREPVALTISLTGDSIYTDSKISLTVTDKRVSDNSSMFPRTISSWFLLESDVRGVVEDPSCYFDSANTDRLKDLDLLLLTQGWRDFTWKYDSVFYPPEDGFTISGRLRRHYSNKSITGSRVTIAVFDTMKTFLTTVPTDTSGSFRLVGLNIMGDARLIVSGSDKREQLRGLLILDSVTFIPPLITDSLRQNFILEERNFSSLKTYYEINEAVKRKYKLSDTINLGEVKIISEKHKNPQLVLVERSRSMYGTPDAELIVTEQMKSYPYLIELLRSNVPGVEVTGYYPNYNVRIRGPFSFRGGTTPLVLINGNNATFEDLVSLPISFIDRIDVLKSGTAAVFGLRGSNGVINLITKEWDGKSNSKPVTYSANIGITGYSVARIFYSDRHNPDSSSSDEPDLRSTLLWNPYIKLSGNQEELINYYNGDNPSVIRISAEGITSTGIPVTGSAEYEIR